MKRSEAINHIKEQIVSILKEQEMIEPPEGVELVAADFKDFEGFVFDLTHEALPKMGLHSEEDPYSQGSDQVAILISKDPDLLDNYIKQVRGNDELNESGTPQAQRELIQKIPFSRKPFHPDDVTSVDFEELDQDTQDTIRDLPIIHVDIDNMDWEEEGFFSYNLGLEGQVCILEIDKDYFLVDNQGFRYARYVAHLMDFSPITVEASEEEVENQKELNKELEKTADISKNIMKEEDEDTFDDDKEPSKSELKKISKNDSVTKIASELERTTKEMKSLAKKYKTAEGDEKEKYKERLKKLTKIKNELEKLL